MRCKEWSRWASKVMWWAMSCALRQVCFKHAQNLSVEFRTWILILRAWPSLSLVFVLIWLPRKPWKHFHSGSKFWDVSPCFSWDSHRESWATQETAFLNNSWLNNYFFPSPIILFSTIIGGGIRRVKDMFLDILFAPLTKHVYISLTTFNYCSVGLLALMEGESGCEDGIFSRNGWSNLENLHPCVSTVQAKSSSAQTR